MIVKLLTGHYLEFLSLGSSESTLLKMSNCLKFHAAALIVLKLEQRFQAKMSS